MNLNNTYFNFSPLKIPANPNDLPVNFSDPGLCQQFGLLKQDAAGKTFYMYISEGLHHNRPCIVLSLPENTSAEDFIIKKSLADFAYDEQVFIALVPFAKDIDIQGRADFINTVCRQIQQREYYVVMQDNIYLMGFDEASADVHLAAAKDSSLWSGLTSFGKLKGLNEEILKPYSEGLQMPVWVSGDKAESVKELWLKRNMLCNTSSYDEKTKTTIFKNHNGHSIPEEKIIAELRISSNEVSLKTVWNYLKTMRRHRCYSHKILKTVSDPAVCGASYHTLTVDGILREWYEYIPKHLVNPDKACPLVFVMHGRGGNAESFFDISDMHKVADRSGFICVFPTADFYQQKPQGLKTVRLWNGSYDSMHFIRALFEDVCSRLNIDKSRVYAFGQSSGGYMASCCMFEASDIFSAGAILSGYALPDASVKIFSYDEKKIPKQIKTPILLMVGDKDNIVRPISSLNDPNSDYNRYISMLIKRMGVHEEQSYYKAPVSWHSWSDKNGYEMLRLGIVDDMMHANYPGQSQIAWDFFEKCSKERKE